MGDNESIGESLNLETSVSETTLLRYYGEYFRQHCTAQRSSSEFNPSFSERIRWGKHTNSPRAEATHPEWHTYPWKRTRIPRVIYRFWGRGWTDRTWFWDERPRTTIFQCERKQQASPRFGKLGVGTRWFKKPSWFRSKRKNWVNSWRR